MQRRNCDVWSWEGESASGIVACMCVRELRMHGGGLTVYFVRVLISSYTESVTAIITVIVPYEYPDTV